MKTLDIKKKYDLSKLNDEQFYDILFELQVKFESFESVTHYELKLHSLIRNIYFEGSRWYFFDKSIDDNTTCATELFKKDPALVLECLNVDIKELSNKYLKYGFKITVTHEKL